MPIYEYTCDDCDADFETLVRGDEQPECPTCGGTRLDKQLSVPAAHGAGASQLPICPKPAAAAAGGCGSSQCGAGRCGME